MHMASILHYERLPDDIILESFFGFDVDEFYPVVHML